MGFPPRIEVSTGYFCQILDGTGVYKGKPYDGIQINLRPDHIATLPDEVGAGSWKDGCGARCSHPMTNRYDCKKKTEPVQAQNNDAQTEAPVVEPAPQATP